MMWPLLGAALLLAGGMVTPAPAAEAEPRDMVQYFAFLAAGQYSQAFALRSRQNDCREHPGNWTMEAFARHYQNIGAAKGPILTHRLVAYRLDKPPKSGWYFRQLYEYELGFKDESLRVMFEFGPGPTDKPELKCGYGLTGDAALDGQPW